MKNISVTCYQMAPNIFRPRNDYNLIALRSKKCISSNIVDKIREWVKDATGIDPLYDSNYRGSEFITSRQLFMYFVRKYTKLSLYATGRLMGKDHSTVVHAIKYVRNHYSIESDYRETFDAIEGKIKRYKKL